ncbi:MAG: formyl transferase [Micavibrio sp.]|nr:formyl transferase [Micavibrio sp.]|tara:strand:- start:2359 stop:3090 length:732 start_codon:yes stop_codon:yes gene_type:complete
MTKVFAVTDNRFIFEHFAPIFEANGAEVDFYCSPKSGKMFAAEIAAGTMRPIILKEESETLIQGGYQFGFSCHSKQIFPAALVNAMLCVNIHPGYNPHNRGWFPQVFSILNKKPAGLTIHVMDEEIDHGAIIVQQKIEIQSFDTSLTAYNKVIAAEVELFKQTLPQILDGSYPRKAMDEEGNYNSIKDYKALLEIDLDKQVTMREAIDYLRAMTHPPYKNAYFLDEKGRKIMVGLEIEAAGED